MKHNTIPPNICKHLFYDSGDLYWRVAKKRRSLRSKVGCLSGAGYLEFIFNGIRLLNHRVIYYLHHGAFVGCIDHIDGNKLNNSISNLRLCSMTENNWNRKRDKRNKSGYRNVYYHRHTGRYEVHITANGVKHYLGLFDCPKAASEVAEAKRKELHGEYFSSGVYL